MVVGGGIGGGELVLLCPDTVRAREDVNGAGAGSSAYRLFGGADDGSVAGYGDRIAEADPGCRIDRGQPGPLEGEQRRGMGC